MASKFLDAPDVAAYDGDIASWAEHQAELMRQCRFDLVDWENVIEEVQDVAGAVRRELRSRFARIHEHLLKLDISPDGRPRGKWKASVRLQRVEIADLLRQAPSMRRELPDLAARAFEAGRLRAVQGLSDEEASRLPERSAYALEQLLDDDYFGERDPNARDATA